MCQRFPVVADARRARHPLKHLQIAATAGAFLAVGFEAVGRVVEPGVALVLLQLLGSEEDRGFQAGAVALLELVAERPRPGQIACFKQRGLYRDVASGLFQALADAAHAVADVEADVPQQADQLLDLRRRDCVMCGVDLIRHQDQQVYVGAGVEFAAAIAANGRQGIVWRHRERRPDFLQHAVHQ